MNAVLAQLTNIKFEVFRWITSPGVKRLSVCMEGTVKVITDKIFGLHLSRTNFRYVVPIYNNVH